MVQQALGLISVALLASATALLAQVATPTLSISGGEFTVEQLVTVSCSTAEAALHYSFEHTPTEADPVITAGTILVDHSSGLWVKAFKSGLPPSENAYTQWAITGQIAAAGNHTVALKSNGDVWAWGSNTNGEIGDGTAGTAPRPSPTRVRANASTFLTSVKAVSAGTSHTIALKSDGTVWAWGLNSLGQLGDGTTVQKLYPVAVKLPNGTPLSGVIQIASGANHNLVLKSDGTVWAWGANSSGQIGDGTTTSPRSFATQVKASSSTFLTGIVQVAAGSAHSAAIKGDPRTGWTWGLNSSGQLGNGSTKSSSFPVQVQGSSGALTNVTRIFCGASHTMAIATSNYELFGWGLNSNGQLADGTTTSPRKTAVPSLYPPSPPFPQSRVTSIKTVAGGTAHTAAVMAGTGNYGYPYSIVLTWGLNSSGQLGNNSTTQQVYPVETSYNPAPLAMGTVAGASHTVASYSDGSISSWGSNTLGQLAQANTATTYKVPTKVVGFGIVTGLDDPDGDGLLTWRERQIGTNPLLADTDADGIPDAWEVDHGLNPLVNDAAADPDGDGASNLQEYQSSSDPWDFYNGATFNLAIDSGDAQLGPASAWVGQPLVVRITNSSGAPLSNAPVTFSLGQASGGLSATSGGGVSASTVVRTDATGRAAAYYQQPGVADAPSSVTAEAGTTTIKQVVFHASTGDIPSLGLKLWLNAEAGVGTSSANVVSTWADQSASRNLASPDPGSSVPAYLANAILGRPALRFAPATAFKGASLGLQDACSIFVVAAPQGQSDGAMISSAAQYYIGTGAGGYFASYYGDGSTWYDTQSHSVHLPAGQFNVLESVNNGSDAAYLNGALVDSRPNPMMPSSQRFALGGSWMGDIAEVLVYDRALTSTERVTVENYLNRRYGCIAPAPTAAPASVRASSGLPTVATIQWDPKNLVSYTIERRVGLTGAYAVIATVESGGVYEDTGLTPGTQYFYRIRANHFTGQSPYSAEITVTPPNRVIPTTTLDKIATGPFSARVVLQATGILQTWGNRPGDGSTQPRSNPVPLSSASDTISVAAGDYHVAILKADGTVWAWGDNSEGQLGDGTFITRYVPTRVPNLADIVSVKAGYGHTLALRQNGTVLAWGDNFNGALGNGLTGDAYDSSVPVAVSNLSYVKQIAAGAYSGLALTADGTVWQWGYVHSNSPVQVPGLTDIVAIAAGDNHALALRMDGSIWAWGSDGFGVLGNGPAAGSSPSVPVRVLNISSAVAITSLHSHNLALLRDGTIYAWGRNDHGELGLGTQTDAEQAPVRVASLNNVIAICTGQNESMAMLADGTVYGWGNWNGWTSAPQLVQLGFVDSNGNGMDDAWEWNYFGNLTELPGGDYDGDGLSNLAEYSGQTNPTDYYNGSLPTMVIVSGNNQSADPEAFLADPLVVRVTNSQGQPLANAPVTFTTGADGRFSLANDGSGALVYSMPVRTDAGGLVATYFQTPPVLNSSMTISAMALTGSGSSSATFTAGTNDLPLPNPPSDVKAVRQADGSTVVTWVSHSTSGQGFDIKYQNNDRSWVTVGSTGPDLRSITIPAGSGPYTNTVNYRVEILFYDKGVESLQTNFDGVQYAVIDLQKDLTLPYYLEPLYLTNSGYLLLWDAWYSYLWYNGQLTDNGPLRDDMDVLEDGTVVPMPTHDPWDNPIDVWKTRNGVSIGGGYYALGMQRMNKINGQEMPFNALDINSQGVVLAVNNSGYFFYSPTLPGELSYFALLNGGWWPYTLNHRWLTITDEAGIANQIPSPQVVGKDAYGAVLANEDPYSGQYHIDYLNRMIPANSGWNLTSAWSINDQGLITAVGTYSPNSVVPAQEKACLLVPQDIIQVDTFIPHTWVFDPTSSGSNVFNGNSRRTLTESIFDRLSTEYKMMQRVAVHTYAEADPNGTQEQNTLYKDTGVTRAYVFGLAVIDPQLGPNGDAIEGTGYISETAMSETVPGQNGFLGQGKASADEMTVTVTHPSTRVVVAHIIGRAGVPFVPGSNTFGPIRYDFTVTINRTDPSHPTYTAQGNHGFYPSMEVYINKNRIYIWDAIQQGTLPNDLATFPEENQDFEIAPTELQQ